MTERPSCWTSWAIASKTLSRNKMQRRDVLICVMEMHTQMHFEKGKGIFNYEFALVLEDNGNGKWEA